ncbi:uncharacterized protein MELLADRAFT_44172 [Melampsora larici-populina 98AG31]|uniref:CWH43-like N-terminal domain-containing protein n=1 Tax=Melampsora larici-populina (strain 98AG31 / pathotype 3-4-7) TaxID=747676 RepID=F4RSV3_MELLP|nr:uncharacterized protein MELLADRAFT_44172 [Melampsora larici-populina 98AG31]EGG04397.1 hypothetical protein MELLADRAFT_44172 [Melampsora larici-populina 98AG31]
MKFITYGAYVWFPVMASLAWLSTLLGLLLLWILRDDHRQYKDREATVVFISDAGAAHLALFIPGCALVFIFYTLSLLSERWLRHSNRIPGTIRRRETYWGIASLITGTLGGFWLLMLSCFNTFAHSTLHWSFTILFILCVAFSSICQTIEIIYLHQDHPSRAHLKRNALLKLCIVGLAIGVAVLFAILYGICHGKNTSDRCNVVISAAGACEWLVSFILMFYFMTFILDLWPAAKTSTHYHGKALQKETGLTETENKIDQIQEPQPKVKSDPITVITDEGNISRVV